jgi:UDP-glucose 4-epimerase
VSLLVTGGNGFVMSNFVRQWLERKPEEIVTVLDRDAPDDVAQRYFGPFAGRIRWIKSDIGARQTWQDEASRHGIDQIVHGAALTPHPWVDNSGTTHDPEREMPERIIDVNLGGTLAILAFARSLPHCRRLVVVSTGSVYGDDGPDDRPLPEFGYVSPGTLYGISKYAAELVAGRYANLFDLPVVAVRLASVFGPMDRVLPSRHVICAPNQMTALALAGEPIRLNSPDGVGDWISALDVANALTALLEAERPQHSTYNIASGSAKTLAYLAELTASLVPGTTWSVDPEQANVVADPGRRLGQWGAYDISLMQREFGWAPGSLEHRLADYIVWRRTEEKSEAAV